jgi:hypothetical protein
VVFATEPIAFAVREPLVDLEAVEHLGRGVAIWLKADDPRDSELPPTDIAPQWTGVRYGAKHFFSLPLTSSA